MRRRSYKTSDKERRDAKRIVVYSFRLLGNGNQYYKCQNQIYHGQYQGKVLHRLHSRLNLVRNIRPARFYFNSRSVIIRCRPYNRFNKGHLPTRSNSIIRRLLRNVTLVLSRFKGVGTKCFRNSNRLRRRLIATALFQNSKKTPPSIGLLNTKVDRSPWQYKYHGYTSVAKVINNYHNLFGGSITIRPLRHDKGLPRVRQPDRASNIIRILLGLVNTNQTSLRRYRWYFSSYRVTSPLREQFTLNRNC